MIGPFKYLYRVERTSGALFVSQLPIIQTTRCGAWIRTLDGSKRFVDFTRAKYASLTPKEAMQRFEQRSSSYIKRLQAKLEREVLYHHKIKYALHSNIAIYDKCDFTHSSYYYFCSDYDGDNDLI